MCHLCLLPFRKLVESWLFLAMVIITDGPLRREHASLGRRELLNRAHRAGFNSCGADMQV